MSNQSPESAQDRAVEILRPIFEGMDGINAATEALQSSMAGVLGAVMAHDERAVLRGFAEDDPIRDLLGHGGDEELIKVIAEAVRDAQVDGRVEYKRRVGLAGRRTIAETVLWRLREHLSTPTGTSSTRPPDTGPPPS